MPVPEPGVIPELHEPGHQQERQPPRSQSTRGVARSTSAASSTSFPGLREQRARVQGHTPGALQQQPFRAQGDQPHVGHPHTVMYQGGTVPQSSQSQDAAAQSIPAYRIGYAPTYDPAADPWHEDGFFPGVSPAMSAFLSTQQYPMQPQQPQAQLAHANAYPYDPWEDEVDQPSPIATAQPAAQQQPPHLPQQGQEAQPHVLHHGQDPRLPQHLQTISGPAYAFPGAGQFDPPTMDPWNIIARRYASSGPLLPPDQWGPNALGLTGGMRPQRPGSPGLSEATTCAGDDAPTDCIDEEVAPEEARDAATTGETPPEDATEPAEVPMDHDEEHEPTGNQDDDDDWESDTSDSEVEAENDEPESTTPTTGKKTPKRAAGHGSQRLANKAKKSDVKNRWRELEWGDKPKWLSWRGALLYIQRGEKPPARQPLPPTPSPQREHLLSLLSAHHYSYDSQGNIVPHHPPRPRHDGPLENSEKAANQAKADHAQRRATNPYTQPTTPSTSSRTGPTTSSRTNRDDDKRSQTAQVRAQPQQDHRLPQQQHQPHQVRAQPQQDHRLPQQQPQPHQRQARGRPHQQVQFDLPAEHREEPPRPVRRQHTWRKLSDSTTVQLKGDGVYNYPVQIVDNRPSRPQEHHIAQGMASRDNDNDHSLNNHLHNIEADTLVVQPLHLTEPTDPSSSSSSSAASHPTPPRDQGTMTHSGGPPLPSMDDLDQQAAAAVAEGRAPAWQIEGDGPSMRSSVRVDDNSHDLSWVQGATPRTLPPPMPLHPQTVLSMRGSITGSWRGTTWSPPSQSVVRHPPRQTVEPTLVIYKTLASQQTRGVLPDGLYITIHRAGDWIATTRFELGFARTPRYWLVVVDAAPQPAADQTDRLPLRPGDSFWLEWRGQERIWQRRPRFHNDIHVLGGFATIPETEAPRPPTPPQRRDPTTQRAQTSYQGGFKSQRFVDTRPLRGRLIPPSTSSPSTATTNSPASGQQQQQQLQSDASSIEQLQPSTPRQAPQATRTTIVEQGQRHRGKPQQAAGKAKPPPPPTTTSGSESETSWPSEDPAPPEGDDAALSQLWAHAANATPTTTTTLMPGDMNSLVQQRRPTPTTSTSEEQARGMPPPRRDPPQPPQPPSGPASQPVEHENPWYSVAANFNGEFTVSGLLRLLQKILHEMLQQTFAMPNEYITHLAYHSCYYISKLMSTNDRQLQRQEQGDAPSAANDLGPTAMVFCITNPFVEAEAALDSLVQHQRDLPRRHLLRELRRAEALLKDGRAIFKSWSRNPNAPGALPGTAASQNALDGVDFSFLASEEGGVASLDESLRIALAAAQRCSHYMNQLLGWIQGHFQAENAGGSPSPKKRRMERPSGSDCRPDFTTAPSNTTLPAHNHTGELPRDVPVRPDDPRRPDSALPHRDPSGAVPGAAPYNILRAQQLLESVMPFTEQEVATSLQEVHSLLFQWTSSLYGASP